MSAGHWQPDLPRACSWTSPGYWSSPALWRSFQSALCARGLSASQHRAIPFWLVAESWQLTAYNCRMTENLFVVRAAESRDDEAVAKLVVEGFLDKFRPVFGSRMDRSVKIMERWVRLEHSLGGVSSLVIEVPNPAEISASVGIRIGRSDDDALVRGLWKVLRRHLGFVRASWAATLLSYPRYAATSSEAYVERLVVSHKYRNQGMAHALLDA